MNDFSELKKLAEAAPEGPWFGPEYAAGTSYVFDADLGTLLHYESIDTEQDDCLRYVAAANPAAVLALISEVEHLAAQVRLAGVAGEMAVHDTAGRAATEYMVVVQELDQLKAKVEALRKDAERYRWLRQYTVKSLAVSGALASLDRDIDAAMTKGAKS